MPPMNVLTYPKYHRQRYILSMLDLAGGALSKTDLQKLLFLSQHETSASYYDFVPYHYGCYSFQAAADIERLHATGWLDIKDKIVLLRHSKHWSARNQKEGLELHRFMKRNEALRGRDLVRSVYDRYPFYAINSRIIEEVASNETKEQVKELKESIRVNRPTVYTIGYEGLSLESYINRLIRNGITLLCDVRRNPLSRKFGFSKTALSSILPKLGIEYLHIPQLGIISEKRQDLNSADDYKRLFNEYESDLPTKRKHIEHVIELLNNYGKIALTCFENDPQSCHRHCVSDYLKQNEGICIVHL